MTDPARVPQALDRDAAALLEAVVAISSELDMHHVLRRIVESACSLTGATYGALGVVGREAELVDFVTHGIDDELHAKIGDLPRGRGILGLLIDHPEPLRMHRLQDHPASYGFPEHHPPMTSFLGVPVRVGGRVFGNLYLTEKAGGADFTAQDEELVLALASAAGHVVDNARAYALSELRRTWLEAAARLDDVLQPATDVDTALSEITIGVRSVSAADAVGVLRPHGRPDPDGPGAPGPRFEVVASDGRDTGALPTLLASLEDQLSEVERTEATLSVPLAEERNAVLVPLRARLIGPGILVAVLPAPPWGLEGEERELLTSYAVQAALALDRIEAVSRLEALAVVTDRERIARDLHDVVIQRLFATGLHLQSTRGKITDAEAQERLDQAVADLDTTIRDIRSTIFELRHERRGSVRGEIADLMEDLLPALGFRPRLRTSGPVETVVSRPIADQLVVVLREALSNVARHAAATWTTIDLEASARELVLRVSDDGRGLPADRRESGLANLRHRAEKAGGSCTVDAREPRGTVLEWRVPLGV